MMTYLICYLSVKLTIVTIVCIVKIIISFFSCSDNFKNSKLNLPIRKIVFKIVCYVQLSITLTKKTTKFVVGFLRSPLEVTRMSRRHSFLDKKKTKQGKMFRANSDIIFFRC
jgi:hypothetical protein